MVIIIIMVHFLLTCVELYVYTAKIPVYIVLFKCTFNTSFGVYKGPRVRCSLNTVRSVKYILQIKSYI